jgi:hypothetical protein
MTIVLPFSRGVFAGEDNITTATLSNSLPLEAELKSQQAFTPSSTGSATLYGSGGYFHPFISVAAIYSDNIYNAPDNEIDDLNTVISPGLLLSYPGVQNVQGASFSTSNLTPGGLLTNREAKEYFQRFQTSLLYHADLENYDDFSNAEKDHHRVEGLFRFNLKGGLKFDLAGEYKDSADDFSGSTLLDEYQSSLVDLQASFDLSRKTALTFGASGFQVDYETVVNDDRDRQDNTLSAGLSYRFRPKTTLFVEYQFIDIDYDLNTFTDKKINLPSAGLKWNPTSRSTGEIEVGYRDWDYEDPALKSDGAFNFMLRAGHDFTPKTSLELFGVRRETESTIAGTNYILNYQFSLAYSQKLNSRFIIKLQGTYSQDQYEENPITVGPLTQKRDDKTYILSPSLEFLAVDWLVFNLSYGLAERDSNFDSFDFTTNTYLLRITGYL